MPHGDAQHAIAAYQTADFVHHRIWYDQVDTYFISKGYFPLWNPTYEMGAPHLASALGAGSLYPVRWLSYPLTYLGGPLNYFVQYVHLAPNGVTDARGKLLTP